MVANCRIEYDARRDIAEQVKRLTRHCHAFKGADTRRSIIQLTTTLAAFFALMAGMVASYHHEAWWLAALLMLPAAGFLVRLFIIQHDCGHGSFFPTRFANDMVGRFISLLTVTPYDFWRRSHNIHHSGSGNLDHRGIGGIDTLTVREYRALSPLRRMAYRVYRNPFILLILGTPLHVLVIQRIPVSQSLPFFQDYATVPFSKTWRSVLMLDLAIAVAYGLLGSIIGWGALLAAFLPVIVITAWVGGWLFFIQHQFEDTYWKREQDWNFQEAALLGSSYYVLPRVLQWFTGNIGLHHIHHLCSLIPNYRLQECMDRSAELRDMNRLTLGESLKCARWALWDEDRRKMVGFRDLAKT